MISMGVTLWGVIGVGLVVVLYLLFWNTKISGIVKILLFEKVGNNKHYLGEFTAVERTDKKLGLYLMIKKVKHAISIPSSDDYFASTKSGMLGGKEIAKTLLVCKYASDDYRVMGVLRNEQFTRTFNRLLYDEEEYYDPDDLSKEIPLTRLVERKDKTGDLMYEEVIESYVEPLGITQTQREVGRFNKSFHIRMDELAAKNEGFWDKYGGLILNMSLAAFFIIAILYLNNKSIERDKYWADIFGETAEGYIAEVKAPSFVDGLLEMISRREVEAEAPPR